MNEFGDGRNQHLQRALQFGAIYHSRPLSRALAAYYRRADHPLKLRILSYIEHALGEKRIVANTQYGFDMAVDRADYIQRRLLYEGVWEPRVSAALWGELMSEDVFFDVGANVGYFTCLALRKRIRQVVAFEPDPLTREVLALNLHLNNFSKKDAVVVLPMALSDSIESRLFYRTHVSNTGQSGFTSRNAVGAFEVKVATLDNLLSDRRLRAPTVLKIDVEGWEDNVLRGAQNLLKKQPPRVIIFETDSLPNGDIASAALSSVLVSYGYSIAPLVERNRPDEKAEFIARRIQ